MLGINMRFNKKKQNVSRKHQYNQSTFFQNPV